MLRRATAGSAVAAILAVLWLYAWTVGAVGGLAPAAREPADNDYYNHLVSGFVHGHLYMDMAVSDGLKRLPDPYNPQQNEPYRRTDASYYHGHYYLYFGAAPAVTLLLPFRLLTGNYLPTPWAILIFCQIGFVAAALLFLAVRSRYFSDSPPWTAAAGVLLLGIGNTAAVLLRRPFFWELATAGGVAYAMLTLAALYRALHAERRAATWLFAAGVLLGLAVASRPTYVFAVPLLALPLLVRVRTEGWSRAVVRMAVAGAVGIGVLGLAVFGYNYARFGNGLEFGHNYLLSIAYESKVKLFGFQNAWFNARMYFLHLGRWSWHPPYFAPVPVPRADMPPDFYTVDDPFGLLPVFPIALLALAAPWALRGRAGSDRERLRAALVAVGGFFVVGAGVILLYVATIPRYAVDFFPAFSLLVALGLLGVTRTRCEGWRRVIAPGVLAATVLSVVVGTVALFDLGRLVSHTHPALLRPVNALARHAEAWSDRWHGIHYGPVEFRIMLPPPHSGVEPLLVRGSDRVLLDTRGAGEVRIGLQHANAPVQWSRTLRLGAGDAHAVRIELGSFYPPLEHAFFADAGYAKASWLTHRAEVRIDGNVALQTFAPFTPGRGGAPRRAAAGFTGQVLGVTLPAADLADRAVDAPPNIVFTVTLPAATAPAAPGDALAADTIPLIVAGGGTATDTLQLRRVSAVAGRLEYRHCSQTSRGRTVSLGAGPHRIEVRLTELAWTQPEPGNRLLVAWIDGAVAWYGTVPAFAADADHVQFVGLGQRTPTRGTNDEYAAAAFAPSDPHRRGGVLLARVMMPEGVKGAWQPLLCTGNAGAADMLSINYMGLDVPQFRYDHWAAPMLYSHPEPLDPQIGHDLAIGLPSFAPHAFGQAGTGPVTVDVDGVPRLRETGSAYAFKPDELHLGTNVVGASIDDRFFRGAFVQVQWLGTIP